MLVSVLVSATAVPQRKASHTQDTHHTTCITATNRHTYLAHQLCLDPVLAPKHYSQTGQVNEGGAARHHTPHQHTSNLTGD